MSHIDIGQPDLAGLRVTGDAKSTEDGPGLVNGYPRAAGRSALATGDVMTAGVDGAIRVSTAIAVLAVATIAAYVSYWHAYAVVRAHGESGVTARLEPATIDGLVYASSMVNLYAARHRLSVPALARWLLALGILATLAANMARAGPTDQSARSSQPGPRSVSSAATSSWSGSSGPQRRAARTAYQPRPAKAGTRTISMLTWGSGASADAKPAPRTCSRRSALCPRASPVRISGPARRERTRYADRRRVRRTTRTKRRTRNQPTLTVLPPMSATSRLLRSPPTRPAWIRGSRFRSASSRTCSARRPAAGRATASRKRARARYRPRFRTAPAAEAPAAGLAAGSSLRAFVFDRAHATSRVHRLFRVGEPDVHVTGLRCSVGDQRHPQ
jgi:Protein of unknown function (DUF2637)